MRRRRTRPRTVITANRVPKGGPKKLWAFGYTEFAAHFQMAEGALRQAVLRGRVDLSSLESVRLFANERRAKKGPR